MQSGASLARAIGPMLGGFLLNNAVNAIDDTSLSRTFWTASAIMFVAFAVSIYFAKTVKGECVDLNYERAARRRPLLCEVGKTIMKCRTSPGLAFRLDRSRMFLNDAVGNGQTETCSVADAFRRKERIEYLFKILWRNTFAGIANLDHDTVAIRINEVRA